MKIKPLTVGPILGATTGTSARIWGRGMLEQTGRGWRRFFGLARKQPGQVPRRCFGVARIRLAGSSQFQQPNFFKMNPNFDMTGISVFGELAAGKEYEYQMGWFYSDKELNDVGRGLSLDWSEASHSKFTTGATDKEKPRSFVVGSCRYLLRLFGGAWFDDRGDKAFRSILRLNDEAMPISSLIMVGDQIYADDLSLLSPDKSLDEYNKRYQEAFSQPYIRALMSQVPTYMTLDDHEIEDNWPSKASGKDWVTKYPAALHAYLTYQAAHGPLFEISEEARVTGIPSKLWYKFDDGCCDFFVTDSRTERYLSQVDKERQIIGAEQLEALKSWLVDASNRVKFVVSAVPLFPDLRSGADDKWSGFIWQRTDLLNFIRQKQIRRVVFLSGDVHSSLSAELISPQDSKFKIVSVISSAFFWPYPHPKPRHFILEGPLDAEPKADYEVVNGGPTYPTDNFTRVTADLSSITVEVFSRKGSPLATKVHSF